MRKAILALLSLAFVVAPIQVAQAEVTYPATGIMDGKQLVAITFNDDGTITWHFEDGFYFTQHISWQTYITMLYRYSQRDVLED